MRIKFAMPHEFCGGVFYQQIVDGAVDGIRLLCRACVRGVGTYEGFPPDVSDVDCFRVVPSHAVCNLLVVEQRDHATLSVDYAMIPGVLPPVATEDFHKVGNRGGGERVSAMHDYLFDISHG